MTDTIQRPIISMADPALKRVTPGAVAERQIIHFTPVEAVGDTATSDVSIVPVAPAESTQPHEKAKSHERRQSGEPVFEVSMPDGDLALYSVANFDPQVVPGTPKPAEEHLYQVWVRADANEAWNLKKGGVKLSGNMRGMWERTVEGGQEMSRDVAARLYDFVGNYLASDPDGQRLATEFGVSRLDALTPNQALFISAGIASDLISYDRTLNGGADNITVQDLLDHGEAGKKAGNIEPLGVCRHYAITVKAVFDALKQMQDQSTSRLNTTVCYDTASWDREKYDPIVGRQGTDDRNGGHAWNTFATISESGRVEAVAIDATWAKRNSEGKLINLTYTDRRLSWMVSHSETMLGFTPDGPKKLEGIRAGIKFYENLIKRIDEHNSKLATKDPVKHAAAIDTGKRVQYYHVLESTRLLKRLPTGESIPRRFTELYVEMINDESLQLHQSDIEKIASLSIERGKKPEIVERVVAKLFNRAVRQNPKFLETGMYNGGFLNAGHPFASRVVEYWKANPNKMPPKDRINPSLRAQLGLA